MTEEQNEAQAGDGKSHPESLSDPPKEEVHIPIKGEPLDAPISDAALVALAPLGYDALEPSSSAILMCAKLCHAVVEAMNKEHNELTLDWADSRDSCIAGVERVLANPGESSAENHAAWMKYRTAEGWTYGPIKDPVAKTHPCMVPYEALGPYQRSKDAVFHAIVRTMFGVK